ncbi:ABC transporter substrate-binding protein [Rhodococcoides yunnanense]|uniref:ABC transporter substrate-binding protein n=1 Tax=Rhodococcoides yunnanense TaxID=278209 RepID=UPI001FE79FB0|nr:ABC transporter substrate-binding protein [Rhodococcus yunnanensis]
MIRSTRAPRARHSIALALGLAAVLTLTACVGSEGPTQAATDRADDGTLTVYSEPTPAFDPRQYYGWINRALSDSLIDRDPDTGEYVPWLATSWEENESATEFTFHLREGATFSDGAPIDAHAVQANFDGVLADLAAGGGWYLRGLFDHYVGTDVIDSDTAVVKFSQPNPPFLTTVATSQLALLSPRSFDTDLIVRRTDFAASGPFVIDSYVPDESLVLKRRPDYNWASGLAEHQGPASIDTIDVRFVAEEGVREGALTSGQIDIAESPTVPGAIALERAGNSLHWRGQVGLPYYLEANFTKPLVQDLAVRRALQRAIDRQEISDSVTGVTAPPADSVITSTLTGHQSFDNLLGHDPDEARSILDDAGWNPSSDGIRAKNGERLELKVIGKSNDTVIRDSLVLIKEQAREVGIEITLQFTDNAGPTWWESGADYLFQGNKSPDADILRKIYQNEGKQAQPWLYTNSSDVSTHGGRLEEVLQLQATEPDQSARTALLAEAQEILIEDAICIPLIENESGYVAAGPRVHGLRLDSLSNLIVSDAWVDN